MSGSYSLPRWYDCEGQLRTFACRTKRVSPFRMIVDVPVVGKVGERVTSYFQDFGEFQCTISATLKAGFLMELEMTRARLDVGKADLAGEEAEGRQHSGTAQ
ncbi:hypothetical protein ABIC01_000811 [Bradyrhizobium sp. RT4b]